MQKPFSAGGDFSRVLGGSDVGTIVDGASTKSAYVEAFGSMKAAVGDLMAGGGIHGDDEWEGLHALGGSRQGAAAFEKRLGKMFQNRKKEGFEESVDRLIKDSGYGGSKAALMKDIKSGEMTNMKGREIYSGLITAGKGAGDGSGMGGVDVSGLGKVVGEFQVAVDKLTTGVKDGKVVKASAGGANDENGDWWNPFN